MVIDCRKVPAPASVVVPIDRSDGNAKGVTLPVGVICAPDAGNLSKCVNIHGARDAFGSVQMVTGSAPIALIPATDGACIWWLIVLAFVPDDSRHATQVHVNTLLRAPPGG